MLVADLGGIFSVGFDLTYPEAILRYDGFTAGPLLWKRSPSVPPLSLVKESGGSLQVSMTRLAPDGDVAAVGGEILLTIHFTAIASGSGPIDFNTAPGSLFSEVVLDQNGLARPAVFSPGHGGAVTTP